MQLIDIDKARYRKHLNIIIVGFIASLLVLSLAFGAILIHFFSTVVELSGVESIANVAAEGAEPDTNFRYNLLGVILALLANAAILHSVKESDFFKEVYYVWQVKQIQNLIFRKLKKIKAAAKNGEKEALIILSFYYQSQKLVYTLDDNTITLNAVEKEIAAIAQLIDDNKVELSVTEFDKSLLATYA
jgi:hypothetical protein